jgi:hypothetical protein
LSRKAKVSVISKFENLPEAMRKECCFACGRKLVPSTPTVGEDERWECPVCSIIVQMWDAKESTDAVKRAVRKKPGVRKAKDSTKTKRKRKV